VLWSTVGTALSVGDLKFEIICIVKCVIHLSRRNQAVHVVGSVSPFRRVTVQQERNYEFATQRAAWPCSSSNRAKRMGCAFAAPFALARLDVI